MKLRFMAKLALAFCLTLLVPASSLTAQQQSSPASANDDVAQQAVIDSVKSYVEAYNRRDAAAVSQHWSETGTWIGDDGSVVQGRENIQKAFAAIFAEMQADPMFARSPWSPVTSPWRKGPQVWRGARKRTIPRFTN